MRALYTAILLAVLAIPCARAYALTVEEAVTFALENNHRISQFGYLEDSAREDVGVKKSAFWPSADLSYSYSDVDVKGSTSLGSTFNRNVAVGTAEATFNLFNGFSDIQSLRESRARAEASMYEKKAVIEDVVLDTRTAYIDVLRAKRAVDTAQEGVELLERQVREARQFYDVGLFAKNDVLKVEVELSTARQDLITAEGDLAVARKRLEKVMATPLSADEVVEEIESMPDIGESSYQELSSVAIENRSELRQLRYLEEALGYNAGSIKGGYLPSIDLSYSHSKYGDKADLDGREFLHDEEDLIMISATWNIFDGFSRKHSVSQALFQQKATREQLRDTEGEVLLQLRDALEGYRASRGRLEAAEIAVKQAEENYRVTENQFRERIATTTDLLDARFFLTRARNQLNNALYDVHLWAARIERATELRVFSVREGAESPAQ